MVKQVISAHAEDEVLSAEHLMRDNHIRRLPVIDQAGHPVGVVSVDDLARWAFREKRIGIDREFVDTLAAVCGPRPRDSANRPLVPRS
jgi:CBS domain-containing protein